jgi:hypothetical protein
MSEEGAKDILSKMNKGGLQNTLQSYSNQNSVVLAYKLTHRTKEPNKKCRNKPMHLKTIDF